MFFHFYILSPLTALHTSSTYIPHPHTPILNYFFFSRNNLYDKTTFVWSASIYILCYILALCLENVRVRAKIKIKKYINFTSILIAPTSQDHAD
jgi:hypothetical protein